MAHSITALLKEFNFLMTPAMAYDPAGTNYYKVCGPISAEAATALYLNNHADLPLDHNNDAGYNIILASYTEKHFPLLNAKEILKTDLSFKFENFSESTSLNEIMHDPDLLKLFAVESLSLNINDIYNDSTDNMSLTQLYNKIGSEIVKADAKDRDIKIKNKSSFNKIDTQRVYPYNQSKLYPNLPAYSSLTQLPPYLNHPANSILMEPPQYTEKDQDKTSGEIEPTIPGICKTDPDDLSQKRPAEIEATTSPAKEEKQSKVSTAAKDDKYKDLTPEQREQIEDARKGFKLALNNPVPESVVDNEEHTPDTGSPNQPGNSR